MRSSESVGVEPDWIITGDLTLNLRAERSGKKDRSDSAGRKDRETVTIKVTKTAQVLMMTITVIRRHADQ